MMRNPEYLVMGAGGLALAGGFATERGFPSNGVRVVTATIVLVLIVSTVKNSRIAPIVTGLAMLMLLASAYEYLPGFTRERKVRGPLQERKPRNHG